MLKKSMKVLRAHDGVALFQEVPERLDIHPLLLVALQSAVFFDGSSDDVILPECADAMTTLIKETMQRLEGPIVRRLQEDMKLIIDYAYEENWPGDQISFLRTFLREYGVV